MARQKKTPEQKAAEAAAKAQQAPADATSQGSDDAAQAEPEQDDGPAELTLHDALHQLTDDHRYRPHWGGSIRKFATNHGLGETATAEKWTECLKKYGVKLK